MFPTDREDVVSLVEFVDGDVQFFFPVWGFVLVKFCSFPTHLNFTCPEHHVHADLFFLKVANPLRSDL